MKPYETIWNHVLNHIWNHIKPHWITKGFLNHGYPWPSDSSGHIWSTSSTSSAAMATEALRRRRRRAMGAEGGCPMAMLCRCRVTGCWVAKLKPMEISWHIMTRIMKYTNRRGEVCTVCDWRGVMNPWIGVDCWLKCDININKHWLNNEW